MKKLFLLFFCIFFVSSLFGQNIKIVSAKDNTLTKNKNVQLQKHNYKEHENLKMLTLPNGMNVVLCEDHSKPQIWGAVCVHAGGKNDPADNTGMAHYLEHLMFKGTDQIGTLDWEKEKEFLDKLKEIKESLG